MSELSTEALLAAWEQGRAEHGVVGRTAALLGLVVSPSAGAALTIGQRDTLLLQLRQALLGKQIRALAFCGGCQERLEVDFDLSALSAMEQPAIADAQSAMIICLRQYKVDFRLVRSGDLVMLGEAATLEEKRLRLLERTVLRAECAGQPIAARELPADVIAAMELKMQEADPSSEVSMRLHCNLCGHQGTALFDAGAFLWKEVDAWAMRLMREVHQLARAYAWREADILAMTPLRRHIYLEMLGT